MEGFVIHSFKELRSSELVVVAPDTAVQQTVGEAAKRGYRKLLGDREIWIVDSQKKGRDKKVAKDLEAKLGIKCVAKGNWYLPPVKDRKNRWYGKPTVYYRLQNNPIPYHEVVDALALVGVNGAVPEHQANSRGKDLKNCFENKALCHVIVL